MKKAALFVTYTMTEPIVGGAFIRALRLATELARRGWECTICNYGPALADPKVESAPSSVSFLYRDPDRPGLTSAETRAEFLALDPSVVIMGEGPFQSMRPFYEAARGLDRPFIVLDQFYYPWLLPSKEGAHLILLYALASFWDEELYLPPPYEITPPFIEAVTARRDLPTRDFEQSLCITLVAYDEYVCRKGMELLSAIRNQLPVIFAITPNPEKCLIMARSAGLSPERLVTLPLLPDPDVFGFFAISAVSLVSNGFLQIMDVLALGCPVIALERGGSIGMNSLNIDSRFVPYVSFNETLDQQRDRVHGWLDENPIPSALRLRLQSERHGCSHCANRIEQVYRQWRAARNLTPKPRPKRWWLKWV